MDKAATENPGAMAAVMKITPEKLKKFAGTLTRHIL